MKKALIAVFAHPDDEAFGPAGTLLQETDAGTELHLFLLTAGENGNNPGSDDLAKVRLEEWKRSGELLGASSQTFFGYKDGQLSNTTMQEVTTRLIKHVTDNTEGVDEIEMMSYEFGGITGHIDHIVASRATAQAFCSLKKADNRLTRLRLFCLPQHMRPQRDTSWIYCDAGYSPDQIDETIDIRHLKTRIEAIMDVHASQTSDATYVKELLGEELGMNWFQVIE